MKRNKIILSAFAYAASFVLVLLAVAGPNPDMERCQAGCQKDLAECVKAQGSGSIKICNENLTACMKTCSVAHGETGSVSCLRSTTDGRIKPPKFAASNKFIYRRGTWLFHSNLTICGTGLARNGEDFGQPNTSARSRPAPHEHGGGRYRRWNLLSAWPQLPTSKSFTGVRSLR